MALSKWFLCGAEGAFEKDEALAVTFADKVRGAPCPCAALTHGPARPPAQVSEAPSLHWVTTPK